jgi:hypothetical protein
VPIISNLHFRGTTEPKNSPATPILENLVRQLRRPDSLNQPIERHGKLFMLIDFFLHIFY